MSTSAVDDPVPTVLALQGRTVVADWGSASLLADLLGRAPAVEPEAEIWFGAHERHPSTVLWRGDVRTLQDVAAIESPTFLVKLIAVAAPLSVQVHPDHATASAGFAAEEAAGVPRDARSRRFVDPSGKPELLRAITPMRVLCGLRDAGTSRALLSTLAPSGFDRPLGLLAQGDPSLSEVVELLLTGSDVEVRAWLQALDSGAVAVLRASEDPSAGVPGDVVRLARLVRDLLTRHDRDAGVLVALLLDEHELAPGEALYVAPGVPHAYLSGLGVEVMASSDNVLRGGMTSKHVDTQAFLSVLDVAVGGARRVGSLSHRVGDVNGWRRFLTPSEDFVLDEADVHGSVLVERTGAGPAVLLCLSGSVTVRAGDASRAELVPGGAVLLRRGLDPVQVRGEGTVVHVRAGIESGVAALV